MRNLAWVLIAAMLSGCPYQHRIYVHNRSDSVITSAYSNSDGVPITIKSGRTKWVRGVYPPPFCFELYIDGSLSKFALSEEALGETKSTGYGGRIDAYYYQHKMQIDKKNGGRMELPQVDQCDDA